MIHKGSIGGRRKGRQREDFVFRQLPLQLRFFFLSCSFFWLACADYEQININKLFRCSLRFIGIFTPLTFSLVAPATQHSGQKDHRCWMVYFFLVWCQMEKEREREWESVAHAPKRNIRWYKSFGFSAGARILSSIWCPPCRERKHFCILRQQKFSTSLHFHPFSSFVPSIVIKMRWRLSFPSQKATKRCEPFKMSCSVTFFILTIVLCIVIYSGREYKKKTSSFFIIFFLLWCSTLWIE